MKMEEWKTFYASKSPHDLVHCELRIKDDMVVSGLNFFFGAFQYLMQKDEPIWSDLLENTKERKFQKAQRLNLNSLLQLPSKEKELL